MTVLAQPPAPPAPPVLVTTDHFGSRRLRVRTLKLVVTLITVLISAWLFTLGTLIGILGLLVAKHVLVAVFLMGSGVHDPRLLPQPSPKDV